MIRATDGEGRTTELISVITPTVTPYSYTDVDGDHAVVRPAEIPGAGPGINLMTSRPGCSVPLADLETFIGGMRKVARDAAGEEQVDESTRRHWSYAAPDCTTISLVPAADAGDGPGVSIVTGPAGCVIPAAGLQAFVAALVDVTTTAAQGLSR